MRCAHPGPSVVQRHHGERGNKGESAAVTQHISTEDPKRAQWRLLSQFMYERNVERFLQGQNHQVDDQIRDHITGSIRQAKAYFDVADDSQAEIAPVLAYYGLSSLILGAAVLRTGAIPTHVCNHGLLLPSNQASQLSDVIIRPCDPAHGALQYYSDVFWDGTRLSGLGDWSLPELLGSIPDLRSQFEICYPGEDQFSVPIESVRVRGVIIDRIRKQHLMGTATVNELAQRIPRFSKRYLAPQEAGNYLILYRRLGSRDIASYSSTGHRYLLLGHRKGNQLVAPPVLLLFVISLYALAQLSRYHPAIWTPILTSDSTGERLLVESFIDVVVRYGPNLVLNEIYLDRFQIGRRASAQEESVPVDVEELERLIDERIAEAFQRRR